MLNCQISKEFYYCDCQSVKWNWNFKANSNFHQLIKLLDSRTCCFLWGWSFSYWASQYKAYAFECKFRWNWRAHNYLGKLINVGTWQERWNTLGHFSQQRSSPPFWHTAHQSSLGSSSFLPSPMWEEPIHPVFPLDEFSCSIPGWSSVLSGASVLKTASSEVELWLLSNSNEVSMLLEKVACKKQRKPEFNIYVNLHEPNK